MREIIRPNEFKCKLRDEFFTSTSSLNLKMVTDFSRISLDSLINFNINLIRRNFSENIILTNRHSCIIIRMVPRDRSHFEITMGYSDNSQIGSS